MHMPDPIVDSSGRDRPRARGAPGRLGGPRPARRPRDADAGRAARVRPARHLCRCRSTRSRRSSTAHRRRHASSPAARAAASSRENTVPDADLDAQREVVDAFLEGGARRRLRGAARADGPGRGPTCRPRPAGRIEGCPGRSGGRRPGALRLADGAGHASGAINGAAGAVAIRDGEPYSVGAITVRGGKIVAMDFLADPERLRELDLAMLD